MRDALGLTCLGDGTGLVRQRAGEDVYDSVADMVLFGVGISCYISTFYLVLMNSSVEETPSPTLVLPTSPPLPRSHPGLPVPKYEHEYDADSEPTHFSVFCFILWFVHLRLLLLLVFLSSLSLPCS
jgi:aminopeptidase-like protein